MAEKPDVSRRAQAWIDALGRTPAGGSPTRAAPANSEEQIDGWRARIDEIDTQLMRLLNSRSACALEIGRIKRVAGLPLYSPEREARILERVARENPGPLDPTAVRRVFERVIDESRRLERLAVQDPEQQREQREQREQAEQAEQAEHRQGQEPR